MCPSVTHKKRRFFVFSVVVVMVLLCCGVCIAGLLVGQRMGKDLEVECHDSEIAAAHGPNCCWSGSSLRPLLVGCHSLCLSLFPVWRFVCANKYGAKEKKKKKNFVTSDSQRAKLSLVRLDEFNN